MPLSIPKHLQSPNVSVHDVVTRAGFVTSVSHAYDILLFAPGTTRGDLKSGKKPLVSLTYDQINSIQDECSTDEEVLFAISHIAEHGTIPNKMQDKIERVVAEKAAEYEKKIKVLEDQVAALMQQRTAKAPKPKVGVEETA